MLRMLVFACCCSIIACGSSPQGPGTTADSLFYSHPDSAWKVLTNLRYAYVTRDLDLYESCFRDDFEFHLPAILWDDYTGDGIDDTWWNLDLELIWTSGLFGSIDSISLEFQPGTDSLLSEDPEVWELARDFELTVYEGAASASAWGEQQFLVRPDATGDYYVWQWWDYSDPEGYYWAELKGGIPDDDSLYYSHPDSTWKVIHNLRTAYVREDLLRYMECFGDDFEFWYIVDYSPEQWGSWGPDTEWLCHEGMFGSPDVEGITLDLGIQSEFPSDSIPGGVECTCPFDLRVYLDPLGGFRALGIARFTLVQGADSTWAVVRWRDESDILDALEATTWAELTKTFLPWGS
jgi:hypothetical protein